MSEPGTRRRISGRWILLVAVVIIGALAGVILRGVTQR
jgi:hypothetical protein